MVTASAALKKYGDPYLLKTQAKYFEVWEVPQDIQTAFSHVYFSAVGTTGFPKKIFVNKDFKPLLEKGLRNVIANGLTKEIKTWDGCFILRNKRNGSTASLHSWALAFDINQAENRQGAKPKLGAKLVNCFVSAGMDWGGYWSGKSVDGMHFQAAKI